MKPIQMVDLTGQYQDFKADLAESLQQILDTAAFINGPEVKSFQAELEQYLGVKHVIPCANGTDALQISMMAAGLHPGDEVICPNFTYIATAEVIALLGLKLVLCDVEYDTFNLDPARLEALITPRTKAIVPVHLYGQCANMAPVLEVAQRHNLLVFEDTAQAIGAEYTYPDGRKATAGTMGKAGATSFYPSKNLGAYGDAGALFTNEDAFAAELRMIANHGQQRQYYFDRVGVNSRLDSIQAAILRHKLRRLDTYIAARRKAAAFYDDALQGIDGLQIPGRAPWSTHVFHQYTLRIAGGRRDALQAHLREKNVPSVVFYPLAVHQHPPYAHARFRDEDYPVTMRLCSEVLSLPMHTELTEDQLAYICEAVRGFLR
ncbi:MAG: DegT/DnrJ/EryC1/StrS family aminotransferase [Bacteroidetes bacterium]|nr:DegT/DnrJ/EryC1/StrS family aminotransferase [Bacteroidota bacterium]